MTKTYTLRNEENTEVQSTCAGTVGGHKKLKIYGRLDCENALRWIEKGHYVTHRVFFADETTAQEAGYRPCGCCMKEEHKEWKAAHAA